MPPGPGAYVVGPGHEDALDQTGCQWWNFDFAEGFLSQPVHLELDLQHPPAPGVRKEASLDRLPARDNLGQSSQDATHQLSFSLKLRQSL
jgi:hypothetical protein